MKKHLQAFLRRLDLDVRRARLNPDVADFLKDRKIDVVLDVGANVGQFGASLRLRGYRGKIVSFEPIESVFQCLSERAMADGNWEAHHCALGSAPGEATINVADCSVFSSILTSNEEAIRLDSRAAVRGTETVVVRTLDEAAGNVSGRMLLKIDTQGYEMKVLAGARQTLPKLMGVLMELPIMHLYEGNWQFHEAVEFMASVGFVPAQIHPVNFHSGDRVSLVEVDCLFRRR